MTTVLWSSPNLSGTTTAGNSLSTISNSKTTNWIDAANWKITNTSFGGLPIIFSLSANSVYLVGTSTTIYRSTDGVNWTSLTWSVNFPTMIVYTNSLFIAILSCQ